MFSYLCFAVLIILGVQAKKRKNPWQFKGTTPGIKEIVIGRCYQYQTITAENRIPDLTVNVDCNDVWNTFSRAWVGKTRCEETDDDYLPFFKLTDNGKKAKDILMFWSGMKMIVHDFTYVNTKYETLEETFPGFLMDNLRWCGCNGEDTSRKCVDGIQYGSCKANGCGSTPFWKVASGNFANKASGIAHVMVNATKTGKVKAYHPKSYFTNYELPVLGKNKLKQLIILVIMDLGREPRERCGTQSIKKLNDDALKYGVQNVQCIDDPLMVHSILCAKYPDLCDKGKRWLKNIPT